MPDSRTVGEPHPDRLGAVGGALTVEKWSVDATLLGQTDAKADTAENGRYEQCSRDREEEAFVVHRLFRSVKPQPMRLTVHTEPGSDCQRDHASSWWKTPEYSGKR